MEAGRRKNGPSEALGGKNELYLPHWQAIAAAIPGNRFLFGGCNRGVA